MAGIVALFFIDFFR